jgi:hypothetical protein
MLDLAAGVTRTSRLACQIVLDPALDGLEVRVPESARHAAALTKPAPSALVSAASPFHGEGPGPSPGEGTPRAGGGGAVLSIPRLRLCPKPRAPPSADGPAAHFMGGTRSSPRAGRTARASGWWRGGAFNSSPWSACRELTNPSVSPDGLPPPHFHGEGPDPRVREGTARASGWWRGRLSIPATTAAIRQPSPVRSARIRRASRLRSESIATHPLRCGLPVITAV